MSVSWSSLSPLRYLLRSAAVWADLPALVFEGRQTTYAELRDEVGRTAGALRELGAGPGDRVAVLLPNVPDMLRLHFAVAGIGAVLVPLNTRLGADEYGYILEHSGSSVLLADTRSRPTIERAIRAMSAPSSIAAEYLEIESEPWFSGSPRAELAVPEDERALLAINYTSGTTGRPKGVMYSHRGAYLQALGNVVGTRLSPASGYLWTLPMFHCNGWAFTWAVTAAGGRHVCLDGFDADAVWEHLHAGAVTHLCGAPTVLTMLAESPAAAPLGPPVDAFVGGAPPSPALLRRVEALGFRVTHLYGLTETYGPLAACAEQPSWSALPDERRAALMARQGVGTLVSDSLRVVDDAMADVAADGRTPGEVVMRGNNVMLGYYRDPAATEAAFEGGWFHSGDLGVMHPDGYVELRGRLKDVIITGGENVSAVEVEHALEAHLAVSEASVVGVPDDRWGETPVAVVVLRRDAAVSADELRGFLRERLAHFKVPRRIEFRDALPRTATGKVRKFVLRDELVDAADG